METKETLRAKVLARRDALPEVVRAQKSARACALLEEEVAKGLADAGRAVGASAGRGPVVAMFAPMRSEVDVLPFAEAAYRRGWRVCFPCMVRDAANEPSRMAFYQVERQQLEAAREGFLGTPLRCLPCAVLEGDGYAPIAPRELDAVVVPLVAFDEQGGRLGYGGGNYDQLLPRLREDALVLGVAFDEQRVPAVPVEPHDRPLPRIVTA